ncbi:hypothetical protein BH23GEM8_BH23GEM8_12710 [soil metagenome]
MLFRLIAAEIQHRPGRAAFLLAGYALGVAVMVVLLAVGEAMLEQARDRTLIGGGDLVVVPAGISPDMLRAGGATSLFLGLDQARFLQHVIFESRRGRDEYGIVAASPILDGKLVSIEAGGRETLALASAEIPSRSAAAGASPQLLAGSWEDSEADRQWAEPTAQELYSRIDRLHLPPAAAAGDSTWAEWHYFNVVLDDQRWVYVTLMLGGRVGVPGEWGGRVLLTIRDSEGHRSFERDFPDAVVQFDTTSPDLRFGDQAQVILRDGEYLVRASAGNSRVEMTVTPSPGRFFPPAQLGGTQLISGYVVPALHATARGTVCLPVCEEMDGKRAYHDHNWGVWRDVSWEWGAASSESVSLLYGVVRGDGGEEERLFAYVVDDRGARGLYRPGNIEVLETESREIDGQMLAIPKRLRFADSRRGLSVTIDVTASQVTRLERERWPWFVQMRGVALVSESGRPDERLDGFFETYLDR